MVLLTFTNSLPAHVTTIPTAPAPWDMVSKILVGSALRIWCLKCDPRSLNLSRRQRGLNTILQPIKGHATIWNWACSLCDCWGFRDRCPSLKIVSKCELSICVVVPSYCLPQVITNATFESELHSFVLYNTQRLADYLLMNDGSFEPAANNIKEFNNIQPVHLDNWIAENILRYKQGWGNIERKILN
ncbi:hypothetical protein BCR41DRAFT_370305 [Lobosporangium transversale]|uniref:Uncharacterized protein n=1 Tax=Lobosporangium transversale TaxID=64571 RepID=A0A1Y2GQS5_9FUNG|nr:hypothetical protein BCR41DRAFT_370305 [Lobosporangium transversale]ORZ17492.1 hypothetical protein BCR41DRAFT_370305 [Lobosporangium transversale]|eukprot:XP_021881879.1 hypothetical protein BCR41DRAFT_370305 [Lobosporangium transversale]